MTVVPSTSAQACSPYRCELHRGARTPLVFVETTQLVRWVNGRPGEAVRLVDQLMVLSVVSLAVGGPGAERWSIDAADLDLFVGASGLAVTAGAGLGGAALLLALFWRPNAEAG